MFLLIYFISRLWDSFYFLTSVANDLMNVNLKFTSIRYIPRSGIAELYCILFLTFENMRLFPEKLSYFTFSLEIYTSLLNICMYPHTET